MISIHEERLVALRDVPRNLPSRASGKRIHVSAIYRWINSGSRGVVLESVRIGGTTYTSMEALERFAAALSVRPPPVVIETPAARRRRMEENERISDRLFKELGLPPRRPAAELPSVTVRPNPGRSPERRDVRRVV